MNAETPHHSVNALGSALPSREFTVSREVLIKVPFHGHCLGYYKADLVVNDCLLIENKAAATMPPGSKEQLIRNLMRSPYRLGLLFSLAPIRSFLG